MPPMAHQVTTSALLSSTCRANTAALWRSSANALPNAQGRELVVVPVPAQVAMDVPALGCAPDGAVAMPVVRR